MRYRREGLAGLHDRSSRQRPYRLRQPTSQAIVEEIERPSGETNPALPIRGSACKTARLMRSNWDDIGCHAADKSRNDRHARLEFNAGSLAK
jgi:transposase